MKKNSIKLSVDEKIDRLVSLSLNKGVQPEDLVSNILNILTRTLK